MSKEKKLKEYLKDLGKVAIAYSGGVDSTYLMKIANDTLGSDKVLGINIDSKLQPRRESEELKEIAKEMGWNILSIEMNQLQFQEVRDNTEDRCYHCKRIIFNKIKDVAKDKGFEILLDGTNYDDLQDFRPGLKALKELKIISPLCLFEFTKEEIRVNSKLHELRTWKKPSAACLASRIPFGTELMEENLSRVEKSEDFLFNLGYRGFRVRDHSGLARIELKDKDIEKFIIKDRNIVDKKFKELGFIFVTIDLNGYEMGTLNKLIKE